MPGVRDGIQVGGEAQDLLVAEIPVGLFKLSAIRRVHFGKPPELAEAKLLNSHEPGFRSDGLGCLGERGVPF